MRRLTKKQFLEVMKVGQNIGYCKMDAELSARFEENEKEVINSIVPTFESTLKVVEEDRLCFSNKSMLFLNKQRRHYFRIGDNYIIRSLDPKSNLFNYYMLRLIK